MAREKLIEGYRQGLVVVEGLMAHGRGEAFDYLLGERTIPPAKRAERAAAALLLLAHHPVLSVNGNTVALAGDAMVALAAAIPARLEVNLFHHSEERVAKIAKRLRDLGAKEVLGEAADANIPGLDHPRGLSAREGIFGADVVLVPLEDGDRTEKLVAMGKRVIAIDLNPLSRTAREASITVVDEVSRALPNIRIHVEELKGDRGLLSEASAVDNQWNLEECLKAIWEHIKRSS